MGLDKHFYVENISPATALHFASSSCAAPVALQTVATMTMALGCTRYQQTQT